MNFKKLPAFALFFWLGAAVAPVAQANLVEGNVTIALKFYYNDAGFTASGKFNTIAFKTYHLKNADFIQALNVAHAGQPNFPFDLKSRIIRQSFFDANVEEVAIKYLLRDKTGKEADVTNSIDVDRLNEVMRAKISLEKGTGSILLIVTDSLEFDSNAVVNPLVMTGAGISRYNLKRVLLKNSTERVDLLSYKSKVGGNATFFVPEKAKAITGPGTIFSGLIEGSVKISGAKAIDLP